MSDHRTYKKIEVVGTSKVSIEDAIAEHALSTVDGIKEHTNASGGCGACKGRIEDILAAQPAPVLQAAE